MKYKVRKLTEALSLIQELEYVPGVSMAVPDFNYTVNQRKNFDQTDSDPDWPYDEDGSPFYPSGGPQNAQGDGQQGVGRGGVGWGGRPDHSGGTREPSGVYDSTWQQDEGADWEELKRHGDDKYRNVWHDTPDGKEWTKMNNEAMGSPTQIGPVAPMDGPSHNVLPIGSGSTDDMLPQNDMRGPGNMWGGPGTIPGTSQGWAQSPTYGDNPEDPWRVPEEKDMRLKEFFDPAPIQSEDIENPEQDHLEDQGDDELQLEPDVDPSAETEPETIATMVTGPDFMQGPDQVGMARGRYGLQTGGPGGGQEGLVDKSSAWDVLQKVVDALGHGIIGES